MLPLYDLMLFCFTHTFVLRQEEEASRTPRTPMQVILSSPLIEPPSRDAPPIRVAPGTRLMITDEDGSALYQSLVSTTDEENNVRQLEETMPQWLAECVLTNKLPVSLAASK